MIDLEEHQGFPMFVAGVLLFSSLSYTPAALIPISSCIGPQPTHDKPS